MVLDINIRDLLILVLCFIVHLELRNQKRRLLPLPPGPARWPIVGNAFSIPLTYMHLFYKRLAEKLGSKIIYIQALNRPIIVLSDIQMARDLLERRSALYSSRPQFPMIQDVIRCTVIFGIMPYGEEWRAHRRIFQQHLSDKQLPQIQNKILDFVRKGLLANIVSRSKDIREHVRNTVGGLSLSMTYGLPVERRHDPRVHLAEQGFTMLAEAGAPGKYLVNIIPPLQYVPEWMPGAGFKKEAKEMRKQLDRLMEEPFLETVTQVKDGVAYRSFVADALENARQNSEDYELLSRYIKQAAMQIFGAVSETTVASVLTFILVMLLHPDVQLKAQREVDSVVGGDRLPDFSDLPQLTFLSAIVKELLRWNPTVPSGVPHLTTADDVYMGYYIPKGSMILANTYAIMHDEEIFPEAEKFIPERFIGPDGDIRKDLPDPESVATFGFGRRICPGAHIARATLSMTAASLLYLFDISPEVDDQGKPILVEPVFSGTSITSEPLPFPCSVTPRQGKDVAALLKDFIGDDPICI